MQKGQHCSPETKAKISAANKGQKLTPEQNAKFQEAMKNRSLDTNKKIGDSVKRLWGDPEYRKRMSDAHKHPLSDEHRNHMTAAIKEAYKRPDVRAKKAEQNRENLSKPEVRAKLSAASKKAASAPGERERRRERSIMRWSDPEERERHRKMMAENPQWWPPQTPHGKDHPNWKGGIAFGKYCPKFNKKLKEEVREKFGRKCYLCPKTEKENGKKLDVHHCDYNKGQGCGQKWSLIPLCHKCHIKTNFNRWYWFNLLSNYWALNPEINFL